MVGTNADGFGRELVPARALPVTIALVHADSENWFPPWQALSAVARAIASGAVLRMRNSLASPRSVGAAVLQPPTCIEP